MTVQTKKVHIIEKTASLPFAVFSSEQRKKRVAAYARVSTEQDEQQSSYEAQVDFYTRHIKNNPEWEFVEVYTDEGISGTSTKKREGFNRMIADALDGKIDLILTKSISLFARNTVDSLTAIRKLKEKGVEVYFEKENIHTMDAKGELMITIMSSLAQEESRSISENVRWGKRKSMADGKFSLAYSRFLGYEKGGDGTLRIVEEEAEIIRKIYSLYLGGQTVRTIADYLTGQGIPTPSGKKRWSVSTIMSILQNEKYKGDALLQKTYTADFLTKKVKKNHGEIQQYYVENSHPAIIDPDTFALVQNEIAERRRSRRQMHRSSLFTAKLICGDCGGSYGRKVLQSNTQYRHHVWRCNQKYKGDTVCATPSLREDEIKECFVAAFNQLLGDKEQYIARFEELLPIITDTAESEQHLAELQSGHDAKMQLLKGYIEENKHQVQDQAEYTERYNALHDECQQLEAQIARLESKIHARQSKKEEIRRWLDKLRQCGDILIEFDPDLWNSTVETVTVGKDKLLTFRFKDGTEIPVTIPDKK